MPTCVIIYICKKVGSKNRTGRWNNNNIILIFNLQINLNYCKNLWILPQFRSFNQELLAKFCNRSPLFSNIFLVTVLIILESAPYEYPKKGSKSTKRFGYTNLRSKSRASTPANLAIVLSRKIHWIKHYVKDKVTKDIDLLAKEIVTPSIYFGVLRVID